jgi:hypothetical protein
MILITKKLLKLGNVGQWMLKTEKQILNWILKTRYKEISEQKLLKKKLSTSTPFSVKFHLLDMMGRKIIFKVKNNANNDYIIRIVEKK